MKSLLVAFLIASMSLAGCSEDAAPVKEAEPEGLEELELSATSTTGIIRGLVVDDLIQTVADATITILNTEMATKTGPKGVFGFQNVEPGTYFIRVSKPGYTETQQSVEVVAGVAEPAITKVLLQKAPGTEPRVAYIQFKGYIGCSYQAANFVGRNACSAAGDADKGQVLDFAEEMTPHVVQTELLWDATQPIGESLTIIEYVIGDGAQRVGNVWGKSPVTCRVTRDAVCDNGDGTGGGGTGLNGTAWAGQVEMRVYANCFQSCVPGTALGLGFVFQQDYQQFGSAFFNFEPEEGWTYIRDGPHPVPDY